MKNTKLKIRDIAAYGVGDAALNIFFTGLNLYLLFYYTDVLGIAPATAGFMIMGPLFWDAVTDPAMSWIASRTQTKYGRYRPYLLIGAPLMSISFVLMFLAPIMFPGAVILASVLAHLLFRTMYTVVSIPYAAMMAAITSDSQERSSLASARMFAAVMGGFTAAILTEKLAGSLGGGDLKMGFFKVSLIYAVIATVIITFTFLTSKERVALPKSSKAITATDTFEFIKRNRAFWILFGAIFLGSAGMTISSKTLIYYVKYYVGDPDSVSLVLFLGLLSVAVSIPVWTIVSRYLSKRQVWLTSGSISLVALTTMLIVAPDTLLTLTLIHIVNSFALGGFVITFWAMLPDTVEYGQWRSGVRDEAVVFGVNQFCLKAASGIGVGLLGILLGAIGYIANQTQTEQTLEGIKYLAFMTPLLTTFGAMIFIWFYPIDKPFHKRLLRVIERREVKQAG